MTDEILARHDACTKSQDEFMREVSDRYLDALRRHPALKELPFSDQVHYVQLLCMQADGTLIRLRKAVPGLV